MSFPIEYVKERIDTLFIAYSNIYIDDAILSLKNSPNAEAVIMQPYESLGSFASTRNAISVYKEMKGNQEIPILFTPQGRMAEEGQYFEYGARLIDIFDVSYDEVRKLINLVLSSGKWVLQAHDKYIYAKKDILVVSAPVKELSSKIPVNSAYNVLKQKQGEATKAVAIPSPKSIDDDYKYVLKELQT